MALAHGLLRLLHNPIYSSRNRHLVDAILPQLRQDDRVLDIGCGSGAIGRAIMDHPRCPPGVTVRGLERRPREDCLIEVDAYEADHFPYADAEYDAVLLADVLHHEPEPARLFSEAVRVSRRLVIVKDQKLDGFLAQWRISLTDWAANVPSGVPCLYRYNTLAEWRDWPRPFGLELIHEETSMAVYPPFINLLFGRRLQYLGVYGLGREATPRHPA
jgi:SAM-dependent methyltransferase